MSELLCSMKHIVRDGMPWATEHEINSLVKCARAELEHIDYRAYYKM